MPCTGYKMGGAAVGRRILTTAAQLRQPKCLGNVSFLHRNTPASNISASGKSRRSAKLPDQTVLPSEFSSYHVSNRVNVLAHVPSLNWVRNPAESRCGFGAIVRDAPHSATTSKRAPYLEVRVASGGPEDWTIVLDIAIMEKAMGAMRGSGGGFLSAYRKRFGIILQAESEGVHRTQSDSQPIQHICDRCSIQMAQHSGVHGKSQMPVRGRICWI
jgi:hypothetical protein